MQCDMCGSTEQLYKADVEGSILNVCAQCGRYGRIISRIRPEEPARKKAQEPAMPQRKEKKAETIFIIAEDYSEKIKKKRESLGKTQKELAMALAERESVIHKLESGQLEPSMELARKLERYLKIGIVGQHEEDDQPRKRSSSQALTIGDMLSMKAKK